jgi:sortase B
MVLLLLYGGYCAWEQVQQNNGAFISNDLLKYRPVGTDPADPTLAELMKKNPDICAWIRVDGTHIDYPVVQGDSDMEYINMDAEGKPALSGAIFVSTLSKRDFSDPYTLLYGHHMDNGAMFGDLLKFRDADFFAKHRSGTLYVPGQTYRMEFFACTKNDAYDQQIYHPDLIDKDKVQNFVSYIRTVSVQFRNLTIGTGEQMIGLSTCAEAPTNGRCVLFGKLIPIEKTES